MSLVEGALSAHLAKSRYATRLIEARPTLATELDATGGNPFARAEIDAALRDVPGADEQTARRVLRQLRQRVLLRVMARDLAGLADLAEVCTTMSDLAEASVSAAQAWAEAHLSARFGSVRDAQGEEQRLIVVGMGKLGGRELNVSSDIDLVFVYPGEGQTDGIDASGKPGLRTISAHEYFVNLGRKLIALLNDATEDGFVFRVDMRLRPDGEAGALALSLDALENYFVAHGREWERYAWIKARALTGERHAELEAVRRPFVFRKYLDYATLAAMRKLHAEVRREVARRDLADHIKLGPGGIREIEFVAQALQLIRGGRDRALAVRPTLEVLPLLAEKRLLPEAAAAELGEAYVFLRNLEHRLQYLDDAQTHRLPQDETDRALVAAMCGFENWQAFSTKIAAVRESVAAHFNAVFAETQDEASSFDSIWQDDPVEMARALREHGYRDPQASAARLLATRTSQRYLGLPSDSRERVDALVPRLAAAAVNTPDAGATLARGLDLIEAIARRASYLALLAEHRRGAGPRRAHDRRRELGGRFHHPPPPAARRAARRPHAPRRARLGGIFARAGRATGRCRGRYRAPDERPARSAPVAGIPPAGAGPGRHPQRREAGRPPVACSPTSCSSTRSPFAGRSCAPGTGKPRRALPSSPMASSAARNSAMPRTSTSSSSMTTPTRPPPRSMRALRSA